MDQNRGKAELGGPLTRRDTNDTYVREEQGKQETRWKEQGGWS